MNRTISCSLRNLTWAQMQTLPAEYGAGRVVEYSEAAGRCQRPLPRGDGDGDGDGDRDRGSGGHG